MLIDYFKKHILKNLYLSVIIALLVLSSFCIFGCVKEEKKPFGAEAIDYNKIEEINNDGPTISSIHAENVPPMAEKTVVENGPWVEKKDNKKVEPTADFNEMADDGGVPIFEPEHKD